MIEDLIEVLTARPPMARWQWLPFFEAYFSNFIEGTRFAVEEARQIVIDGVPFAGRLEDAHDVAATYRLATDEVDRSLVPRNGDELIAMLRDRHRVLMAARTDKHPGEFRERMNFAGGYQFVSPELVVDTLVRGFAVLDFAQHWTRDVDWSTYEGTDRILEVCNAYLDPVQAESTGRQLQLP